MVPKSLGYAGIAGVPAGIGVETDPGSCQATVIWPAVTASDNCGIASLTSSHEPGDVFPVGNTVVSFEVKGGKVAGALSVGRSEDLAVARELLANGVDVSASKDALGDADTDLGSLRSG